MKIIQNTLKIGKKSKMSQKKIRVGPKKGRVYGNETFFFFALSQVPTVKVTGFGNNHYNHALCKLTKAQISLHIHAV